ncbi:hypothetical protein HBB16_08655 [Pseudonocardia sp. MCCB 268]|nr:hypothetical protein [Pseudonocardia cytotoxica]
MFGSRRFSSAAGIAAPDLAGVPGQAVLAPPGRAWWSCSPVRSPAAAWCRWTTPTGCAARTIDGDRRRRGWVAAGDPLGVLEAGHRGAQSLLPALGCPAGPALDHLDHWCSCARPGSGCCRGRGRAA